MYRHWHDNQDKYTKIVLKTEAGHPEAGTEGAVSMSSRKLAIVTGASSGIGLEIAKLAAQDGYDLIVAADTPFVEAGPAFEGLRSRGGAGRGRSRDFRGHRRALRRVGERRVDVLVANAGHGLGHAFLDQEPQEWLHVINTNVTGTLLLIQRSFGGWSSAPRARC